MRLLYKIIPFFDWIRDYNGSLFKGDLVAGLTTGVMLIPQGMAYALIAGLPPVYGLYAALIPPVIYAFLGTSRQLSVGPAALDSLFVGATVSMMAIPQSEHYIELAVLLALMVGALQFIFGLIRLGFIVNFLSSPVIVGFTGAAAIIIALNQVKYLFGTEIQRDSHVHSILEDIFAHFKDIHPLTLTIGLISIGLLLLARKFIRKFPSSLVLVIVGVFSVLLFSLDGAGVEIVGEIPSGLPDFNFPGLNTEDIMALMPAALALSLVAYMEAITVAKMMEEKHEEYEIRPNQELIALGACNMIGSMFHSLPVTAGLSRTAVNDEAGAKTGIASIISALVILLTLLFLTDFFYYLPKVVLAAIIIVAVSGLINIKVPVILWNTDKKEFAMYAITLVATATLGIQQGLAVGVIMSLILLIYKVATPHMAVVGKFPGTNLYRNVERFEDVDIDPEIMIVRFDARLFYANMNYFRDKLIQYEKEKDTELKAIIIDGSGINSIDSSAISMVNRMIKSYQKRGILLLFSGLKGPVRDVFKKHRVYEEIGIDNFFVNIENAEKFVKGEEFTANDAITRQSNF